MKFSELYPDLIPITGAVGTIMRGNKIGRCSICGQPTEYIDFCYEGYFCSEECLKIMDNDYIEHERSAKASDMF